MHGDRLEGSRDPGAGPRGTSERGDRGVVTGLLAGLALFVATNWLVLKGGRVVGPHLALLGQYFIGYRVSFVGSLIGFAWAFSLGFLVGAAVVAIYNRLADLRDPPA